MMNGVLENGNYQLGQFQFDGVMDMKIREVNEKKKQFISLLLLADEQESMVDRYLEKELCMCLKTMM